MLELISARLGIMRLCYDCQEKCVCHLWELGGGCAYTSLLTTVLRARSLTTTSIFMVVDLTRPEFIWVTVEALIAKLRDILSAEIQSETGVKLQVRQQLYQCTRQRITDSHPDRTVLSPLPVPLVFIASKYDELAGVVGQPDHRRLLCRSLRFLAHMYGAALYSCSLKLPALTRRARELFNQYAFDGPERSQLSQDYSKPLLIPAGADSLSAIVGADLGMDTSYNAMRNAFTSVFPQEDIRSGGVADDPCKDVNFLHPVIDQRRAEKDQDMERLRADNERKRCLAQSIQRVQ